MKFKDKVVLVTGSSRGIGAGILYDFAKEGASVIINYNNSYDDAVLLREKIINDFDAKVMLCKCDVSNEEEVINMVDMIISKFGKIDILVNNAGLAIDSLFDEKSFDDFSRIINVNLIGTYLVSKYVGKYMVKNKFGRIINIASDNAIGSYYPESADYDASKAGVISLTHNMARFYSPYVNVNCVCPGWIDTDMNKELDSLQRKEIVSKILVNRFGKVSDVSNLVLFLASCESSFINDSVIKVNGGISNEWFL